MHPPEQPIIVFRPDKARSNDEDETFTGNMKIFDELNIWAQEKCVPLVREITFENAEELTEEGLPFLILFHKPDDNASVKDFKDIVATRLTDQKRNYFISIFTTIKNYYYFFFTLINYVYLSFLFFSIENVNFLTADGLKFAHPLHHLGKSEKDLPLVAIDSFRHMYLFPNFKDIYTPGKLKSFLQDLYSGKLHREFHYGPDNNNEVLQIDGQVKIPTAPPESTFKKLAPSKNRYTLLEKDEL